MKTKELIEYLKMFDEDCEVNMIAIDPKKRIKYNIGNVIMITDAGLPVFGIELNGEHDFEEDETAMAEECEAEAQEVGE